jgi:hypothetical protein
VSELEDLTARIEVVLRQMSLDLDGWRRDGLARNSTLTQARELLEEAQWEQQSDLAGRLASRIEEFEGEIEHGRPS